MITVETSTPHVRAASACDSCCAVTSKNTCHFSSGDNCLRRRRAPSCIDQTSRDWGRTASQDWIEKPAALYHELRRKPSGPTPMGASATPTRMWSNAVYVTSEDGRRDYVAMAAVGTAHEIALATIYEDPGYRQRPWRVEHEHGKHATLNGMLGRRELDVARRQPRGRGQSMGVPVDRFGVAVESAGP